MWLAAPWQNMTGGGSDHYVETLHVLIASPHKVRYPQWHTAKMSAASCCVKDVNTGTTARTRVNLQWQKDQTNVMATVQD